MKWNSRKNLGALAQTKLSFMVCAVTILICVCEGYPAEKEEVIFYEDSNYDGNRLFITLAPGCYSLDRDWENRISSVDTQGHCIMAYESKDCRGDSVKLAPGVAGVVDLRRLKFDNEISSIKQCPDSSSKSRGRNKEVNHRGLDIWRVGLEEHNKYRRMHGVPDLKGDIELHEEAQFHADYLANHDKFELSPQTKYGENLATSFEKDKLDAIRDVVGRWYAKKEFYNFRDPESNKNIPKGAQFSSVIWKNTSHLGVGVAWNAEDKKWVVVCMYSPPATMSRYKENVPPATRAMRDQAPSVFRTDAMGNVYNSRSRYGLNV